MEYIYILTLSESPDHELKILSAHRTLTKAKEAAQLHSKVTDPLKWVDWADDESYTHFHDDGPPGLRTWITYTVERHMYE